MSRLVMFVKAPVPGRVKTRLCPPLSAEEAASVYRALVKRTLSAAWEAAPESGASLEVAYDLSESYPDLSWLGNRRPSFFPQEGIDLGQRLTAAFGRCFALGSRKVVVIGSDIPDLQAELMREAFAVLDRADVALGPAQDGGYYLIGLRQPQPRLFEGVPWSTPQVLSRTEARIAEQGLSCRLLAMRRDVDTYADLAHFAGRP